MPLAPSKDGHPSLSELYDRVKHVMLRAEWQQFAPTIEAILRLKQERDAVILAHNYQTPEIYHGVADIVGDSLALAREAVACEANVIVMAGVHFMAETVKLLNPGKTILIPDERAGCSLAESITAAEVMALRAKHPGVPVVTYVNTSAEVKAVSDVCCTSGNAVRVVEAMDVERVIFLPDEYLGRYVGSQTDVDIITWQGHCEVHERFTGTDVQRYRRGYEGLSVLAHPECPPDVLEASDFVGSTAQLIDYVKSKKPERVVMLTECSMSDNVAAELPEVDFVRPCNLCPHMKRITLDNIKKALETLAPEVQVPAEVAAPARRAVERMLQVV